jgi:hypothetical protein
MLPFACREYYAQETHALATKLHLSRQSLFRFESLNSRDSLANLHNDLSMHQYNTGLFKFRFLLAIYSAEKSFLR